MKVKYQYLIPVAMLTFLLMPGCLGYKLGSSLPADIHSIFIPTFKNLSDEPFAEVAPTSATISEFQRDGTLEIVGRDKADVVLECTLTSVTLEPIRYSRINRSKPNEYRLKLTATFVLKRTATSEILGKSSVTGDTTFIFTGNITSAKKNAMPGAAEDLAKKIVEKIVEVW